MATRIKGKGTIMDRDVTVNELMTTEVLTLASHHPLTLADEVMSFERIRHLPVLEEGQVVGVVSQRDLFRAALAAALGYQQRAHRMLRRTITITEVMSAPAITVPPETMVKDAARMMIEQKIGCLPVVKGNTLVGIITETDILRYVVNL
jgi:CBS domain-containing membrane protein